MRIGKQVLIDNALNLLNLKREYLSRFNKTNVKTVFYNRHEFTLQTMEELQIIYKWKGEAITVDDYLIFSLFSIDKDLFNMLVVIIDNKVITKDDLGFWA